MPYVIAAPCVADFSCAAVCPVDCIQPGPEAHHLEQLYIDPASCIECGACVDVCPVEAIFERAALPPRWDHYAAINRDYFAQQKVDA
jgi:NAD-dependent dihydropyrimidine dehydrogenase PreA subunit